MIPNLKAWKGEPIQVVLLQEARLPQGSAKVADYVRSHGFAVHEIPVRGRMDLAAVDALKALWRSSPPALIHAHGPKATLFASLAHKAAPQARLLTTHHGVRANDQSIKLRFFESIYERLVIPRCDLCLTVCTSDRELLIKRSRRRVPASRFEVHLNGVDRPRVGPLEREERSKAVRASWGIDPQTWVMGVVGRLSPEKQYPLILESIAELLKSSTGISQRFKLLCFGSGPLELDLKQLTQKLGLQDVVQWMGYRPQAAAEMVGLDVLVSLSSAEGLPINLIEAAWVGTPVLAHAVDGVNDLIPSEDFGRLLRAPLTPSKVAQSLRALATDREKALALGQALQTRVEASFSLRAWVARLGEVYASELLKTR